ncbi:hypothetical protein JCM10212_003866 [Sporobolomyces blumeae]
MSQARPHVLSLRNGSTPRAASPPASPTESTTSSDDAHSDSFPVDPLREQIVAGLKGTESSTVPGATEGDQAFAFKRSIPTMVLYSERGLEIYEQITKTKAYYPFEAEKEILESYGDEIACRMFGLPTSLLRGETGDEGDEARRETSAGLAADKGRWGDASVGIHNYGVNGGMNVNNQPSYRPSSTVGLAVELGSGSLDKTRHLLRSMAKLLQPLAAQKSTEPAGLENGIMSAIEYKALDLEAASLYSTLSSLASIEGESVTTSLSPQDALESPSVGPVDGAEPKKRRVSVSGLHATYDEGLAFLKEQNAKTRRGSSASRTSESSNGRTSGGHAAGLSPATSPTVSPERLPDTIDEEDDDVSSSSSSDDLATPNGAAGGISRLSLADETATNATSINNDRSSDRCLEDDEVANGAEQVDRKTSILWLGSSIGNFTRNEAVEFLRGIDLAEGDTMLIGVDGCAEGDEIEVAYNDPEGVTRDFILEGVDVAGRTLHPSAKPGEGLCRDNFEYVNRWNAVLGRHEAYIRANKTVDVPITAVAGSAHPEASVTIEKGELLQIEVSYKYTPSEALALFHLSGLRLIQQWTDSSHRHSLYLVEKPGMFFPSQAAEHVLLGDEAVEQQEKEAKKDKTNPYGLPSMNDWEEMFRAWDWLMHEMIPASMRFTKPIPLRHVPLFYVGHAPAFRDIHLSRHFSEPLTAPTHFAEIFERGIDPDVDDSTKIGHWHSEVPKDENAWPEFDEIVEYEERVRERVRKVYEERAAVGNWDRRLARVLMMVFEHEMMHFETSVYICLQACSSLNHPLGTTLPDFPSLARFEARRLEHERTLLGSDARAKILSFDAQEVLIGHDDDEDDDQSTAFDASHEFGWDCESPQRAAKVDSFKIDCLPITNGQYLEWLATAEQDEAKRRQLVPASWAVDENGTAEGVKTLWGVVKIEYALEWPVAANAEQLERFAKSKGGRLPTQPELSLFLAQNPTDHPISNVGLSDLHAVPPSLPTPARDGSLLPATNGGLWEWTSTILAPWPGFKGSKLYPGYSSDFHDNKHRVVLGGSWASPRRIARRTFVNFYQAGYPYALIGGRVAYDA